MTPDMLERTRKLVAEYERDSKPKPPAALFGIIDMLLAEVERLKRDEVQLRSHVCLCCGASEVNYQNVKGEKR
jgi:hypothetical protein